ncbi:MAG: hypothetical protein K8I27_06840 [Planctomycetes bacterium]|nr:hypothetical protein [Planctomycetota bacterium]
MEDYREDLSALVRGRLDPERAGEILRAAEHDAALREAIEQERSLEQLLDLYDVPDLDAGFEGRFWRRFHNEKVTDSTGRVGWLFKLVGPLAAGVLIAVGVILFVNRDEPVQPASDTTADQPADPADMEDAPVLEVEWDDSEFEYIAGGDAPPTRGDRLDLETLELLRTLDDPAFLALDDLARPDDMLVIDELELLAALSEGE